VSAPTTSPVAADPVEPSEPVQGAASSSAGSPPADPAPAAETRPAGPIPDVARPGRGLRVARAVATSACLVSGLFLGFGVYAFGLTGLQEQHSQANLYRELDDQLSQATAPTGPAADGAPLAIVDIPAIGLHRAVAVEGTTGADLARGPGHLRDTVLPGQDGVSVLLGRRATFGAPFARLTDLRVGDKINVTTGQGRFSYTVNAFGQGDQPVQDTFKDRLLLVTGDSTWIPTHAIYVGARLDGTPAPRSGQRVARGDLDKPLASDTDAWSPLQLWALALAFAVALTVWLVSVWNRRAVYLSAAPVLAALLWCVYENAALLLPNLY